MIDNWVSGLCTRVISLLTFTGRFGEESDALPPMLAAFVGGDADKTGRHSMGYVDDVRLEP